MSKGCWVLPDCSRQRMPSPHPLAWSRTRFRWGNAFMPIYREELVSKEFFRQQYLPELQGVRIGTQERSLGPIELK